MAEHLLARGTVAENHREAFAGQGAVAELLVGSAMAKRMAAPWRIAIGKLLVARGAVAELLAVSAMAKRMAAPWRKTIGKLLLARGAAAEHHREAATAGKEGRATAGKEGRATAGKGRYCWKGEPLPDRRITAGKERSATAGKKGLQRSNGLVSFFDAPLMQIIPIFVVW